MFLVMTQKGTLTKRGCLQFQVAVVVIDIFIFEEVAADTNAVLYGYYLLAYISE